MAESSDSIEVLFLGTGAADGPDLYRPAAGEAESGTVRGRSSILVDGRILVDFGVTVADAIRHFGADVNRITDILLTHAHSDHCSEEALRSILSQREGNGTVGLWAHPTALAKIAEIAGVCRHPVEPGDTVELTPMAVTALAANHVAEEETPLHFLLQKSEVSVLYATDGAWFLKPTWFHLREHPLDAILWDATCGETEGDWRIFEHNSVDMIRVMRQSMERDGVLSPTSQVYLTHMSPGLCAPHSEMVQRLTPEGFVVAHDGLEISVGR